MHQDKNRIRTLLTLYFGVIYVVIAIIASPSLKDYVGAFASVFFTLLFLMLLIQRVLDVYMAFINFVLVVSVIAFVFWHERWLPLFHTGIAAFVEMLVGELAVALILMRLTLPFALEKTKPIDSEE